MTDKINFRNKKIKNLVVFAQYPENKSQLTRSNFHKSLWIKIIFY